MVFSTGAKHPNQLGPVIERRACQLKAQARRWSLVTGSVLSALVTISAGTITALGNWPNECKMSFARDIFYIHSNLVGVQPTSHLTQLAKSLAVLWKFLERSGVVLNAPSKILLTGDTVSGWLLAHAHFECLCPVFETLLAMQVWHPKTRGRQ